MRVEISDYKTGWVSVEIYLKERDIVDLISSLNELRQSEVGQHFHISNSNLKGTGGIFDIDFIKDEETEMDTFQGPSSLAKASGAG